MGIGDKLHRGTELTGSVVLFIHEGEEVDSLLRFD